MRLKAALCALVLAAFPARAEKKDLDKEVFSKLLKEYKNFPEFFTDAKGNKFLKNGAATFDDVNPALLDSLTAGVRETRYREFNSMYLNYAKKEKTFAAQIADLEKRMEQTALSDIKARPKMELDIEALRSSYRNVRYLLFLLSVDANTSFLAATKTLSPADVKTAQARTAPMARPKMPGIYGGAAEDRKKVGADDKLNVTPVDPEFYATQLGKKLERDMNGRADFWSYDYDRDELFVQIGSEVGKVSVKEEGAGVRFFRTRVGSSFMEPRGSDERVDFADKKNVGKFVTGNKNEETLFGPMPASNVNFSNEKLPAGHSHGDGHDHSH